MTSLLLLADPIMGAHSQGPLHPEDPARLDACLRALRGVTLPASRWAAGRDVTRDELARLHDPAYVDAVERARGEARAFDVDVTLSAGSVPAAVRAAGASLSAVEEVCAGAAKAAFALVRPPGHHAERGRAMGFCVYNNVALAAAHAIAALGCARVLIIDWDVHH
ncbi:MAG: histone deacetylase, partial [Myxococcales bacterium]|nr:histone deacetylase [Myxococcales bacterium]